MNNYDHTSSDTMEEAYSIHKAKLRQKDSDKRVVMLVESFKKTGASLGEARLAWNIYMENK